jgi:hypothetical protein
MSSKELLAEINRLSLPERIALLEQIAHSLREDVTASDESPQGSFDPSAIDRLHAVLRNKDAPLTDEQVEQMRDDYLMEKYK